MDSIPGEDPTLPLGVNSGLNFSRLPDVSGDEVRSQMGGGGVLPEVAEETVSPSRARTMKDFENQITELRKENFNLKLRIYFLEDRIQQKFDGPHDDVYRINIELKVELESVKRELQQREQLLRKASKAVESLAQGGDAEIQRLKEDAEKKVQEVEASLTSRIRLLEEDLRTARVEVEKAFALTERERVQRLAVEQQLSLIITAQAKDIDITALLGEKDRCIEQLSLSLERKNAELQLLEEGQRRPSEESQDPGAALNGEKEKTLEILKTEFSSEKKDLEKKIEGLQENLRERETELSAEKKNALKRDKTIQGLTLVLKTKENENGELASEIESLKASLAKSGEIGCQAQTQKFKGAEDPQELLMEKESLLADLRSENLTKDTENRKLQRKLKRVEQELSELLLEKEKLARDLEEAGRQKNQSDKTIHDLRNQLEKTQNELAEKEKAMELHYQVLLSEEDQRLQNQELVIARLTDGVAQKDELLQTLDGVIREKDLRLQEWSTKFQNLEKNKERLERQNEVLIEEKCAAQSEQLVTKMMHELERIKESEYSEMLETLRKEHTIFATLIKSLKDADGISNLQEELNTILALRKQLEEGILETWNLRRTLEEQIRDNRKEEDTPLSWSNQTSYMSICLRDQDHRWDCPVDQLSVEELKKKFVELLGVVKEMHWVIQELKRKPFDFSTSDPSGNKQKSLDTSELLERTEESQTLLGASDEEVSAPSCDCPETLSEIIPLDSLDQSYKTLNSPEFEPEPVAGKYFEESPAANNCDTLEENPSPVCLLKENGVAEFGSQSRQGQSQTANEPLDPQKIADRDSLSDDLENKEEGDLKQLIIQLRSELEQLMQANVSLKQQGEPQLIPDQEDTKSELSVETESSKVEVKDTATQTITGSSGGAARPKHEGKRTTVSKDGATTQSSRFDQDCRQRYVSAKSDPQKALLPVGKANKSNSCYQSKKSRLPVLLKPSRSLGSISLMTPLPRPDLQPCAFTLDQGLKGRQLREEARQSEAEGHGSIRKDVRGEDKKPEASAVQPKVSEADLNLPGIQSAGQKDQDQNISNASKIETEREIPESKQAALPELLSPLGVPEKQYGDLASVFLGGMKSPSLKQSALSFDAFDCEAVNDIEDLRQRIRDLKSVVEKYQMLLIQFDLIEPRPPSDPLDHVPSDGESPFPAGFKESEPELTSFSNETQPKEGVEDSSGSGPSNDRTVQKLRELLSENEAELEKEQMANMKLVDEVHRLHDKLKSVTPRDEPDFSACPSLHEESLQRQKIHESHNICATYRQHLSNLIRAFEDLLRDSEVDYYVAESFREQLNQSAQIFERLEHQCLYGESIEDEMIRLCNLAQSLSDFEIPQQLPSSEGPTHGKEEAESGKGKPTATPTKFPPELLMEHLQEIRLLRHRLEDSIKTNDHLRKQLEQQASTPVPDQDFANAGIRAMEQLNSLTSEIHFLRKQNQTLNGMLAKGSREGLEAHLEEKQKENEALRESLTQKHLAVEGLQKDHELLKKENEKLREQVGKGEVENEGLTHEIYNVRNELNRLQMELATKQHQLSESDKLLCSLRVELKVYEKLDEALQNEKDRRQKGTEECQKDQSPPLDLGELLTEIQFLRKQLEQSIKSNQMLHEKVEEQLRLGKGEKGCLGPAVQISYLFGHESQQLPTGIKELSFSTLDSPSHCNLLTNKEICPVPSHCVWADKNGQHILGLIEDYNCLRKQITEGRKRLAKLELHLKEAEGLDSAVTVPLNSLSATFKAVQQNLEEAGRLLNLLWRVSLPMKVVHAAAYSLQDESLKSEVYKLRRKVTEQEKKLYSMAKRLYSTNQLKENMERVIIDQLALTHNVLKKARGNLEVQPSDIKATPSSLIKKRV
ncbi:LOW QUALITY PROTEIN: CDK5 regulatory subunit-associated protein 2 [Pantherophis guttatus]|uniref:CDK5 regulatory subunit-associated protein 2 n=1 Tax=Pantherophis guttatus TaxID=94885 RepID=A0ABM3ZR56_PANGU|nr:LOW QUALITY PROTEIN: CDK5 regulatory subunit-associated protein 2 [Pantherophis guttatus]